MLCYTTEASIGNPDGSVDLYVYFIAVYNVVFTVNLTTYKLHIVHPCIVFQLQICKEDLRHILACLIYEILVFPIFS